MIQSLSFFIFLFSSYHPLLYRNGLLQSLFRELYERAYSKLSFIPLKAFDANFPPAFLGPAKTMLSASAILRVSVGLGRTTAPPL